MELVDASEHWVAQDSEGFDGRYINQWAMVMRCWELMERTEAAAAEAAAAADGAVKGDAPQGGGVDGAVAAAAAATERAAYVIRARPDIRVACLPTALEARGPYLALQERLWGSDNFLYGDRESMRTVCCELAPKYDEYTRRLGQASSEPMMQRHVEELKAAIGFRRPIMGMHVR